MSFKFDGLRLLRQAASFARKRVTPARRPTATADSPTRERFGTVAFVDVADSTRLLLKSEAAYSARIYRLLDRAEFDTVPACGGVVAERRWDGLVLTFAHTRDAVRCVALIHRSAAAEHAQHPGDEPLRFRAGLHKTHFRLDDNGGIYGAGVNLASRMAGRAICDPGETVLSSIVADELTPPLDGFLQDLTACRLTSFDDEPLQLFCYRETQPPLPADIESAISSRMKLRPTIAVLPLDGDALEGDTRFGLGDILADQLIRRLSQSSVLHVISALSARALRGRYVAPQTLYEMLRADYLLRGRIKGGGEGHGPVELHGELWQRGNAEPIWNEVIPGSALDVLSLEGQLVGTVVHAVSKRVITVEQRAAQYAKALPNIASHTMYLSAVDLLHRFSKPKFDEARELLVRLSERAPRHAEPMAWLARWHVFRMVQGWSDDRRRDSDEALRYSARALDRDPNSSLALTMAGSVHAGIKRDAETAQTLYQKALDNNPNDSLAWLMSGVAQGFMNAREPALAASELALGLAPVDPIRHYYDALSATAALRAGEYERCITLAERAISANGTHGTAYRSMAIAQKLLGRHNEAKATIGRMLGVEPAFTVQTYLGRVPVQDSNRERFAELLQEAGLPAH